MSDQNTKQLERIANELSKMNRSFELMLKTMEKARFDLTAEPMVKIGSTGEIEPKQSDK